MIRALSIALPLLALVAGGRASADDGFGTLTPTEVKARLGQKGFFVFDNNPIDVFHGGHVPGAKWLDYKNVTAADLPPDKEATLVFYCANEH
jgi:hypothetical protein